MNPQGAAWRDPEKIRQQFDYGPYPRIPLERSPKEDYNGLYEHNLVTPYYLHHRRVVDTQGKVILDAGCGSGYKALMLAEANPGAKIVGIDLSEQSIHLARQRLAHHGIANAEFHQLSIEEIAKLGIEFDYINCDEVLYLLPDPVAGLKALKSVLKPNGILRANLHSAYQRACYYRAQAMFKMMGLMDANPEDFEEATVIETMTALKDDVRLKKEAWNGNMIESLDPEKQKELLAMNFLFIGDTGYKMPEMFELLDKAGLSFVSMVDWRTWDITDLFQEPDDLPLIWGMSLATATVEEKLCLFELLQPTHRLLDFWCAESEAEAISVDEWSDADWQNAIVHLHPQLQTNEMKQLLIDAVATAKPFEISAKVTMPALSPVFIEAPMAACLLPLWESAQPIQAIAQRYRQIRPVDPATLEPITEADAFEQVRALLNRLDAFLYVLLELAS